MESKEGGVLSLFGFHNQSCPQKHRPFRPALKISGRWVQLKVTRPLVTFAYLVQFLRNSF